MATNAAAALCAAGVCGVDIGAAAVAVGGTSLSPSRMELRRTGRGALVINDAYNANPESIRAALMTLAALPVSGRRVAILGMMAELDDPAIEHERVAALAGALGIELVVSGTELYGVAPVPDPIAVGQSLSRHDAVLIKGSLVAGMQRVAALVIGEGDGRAADQIGKPAEPER